MKTEKANLDEMNARLQSLAKEIKALEAKVHERQSEVKEHIERVGALHSKHKSAHEMLEDFRKATHEELATLKSGWEEIVKDMQAVLDELASLY